MMKRINITDSFADSMIPGLAWGLNKVEVISILGKPEGEDDSMLMYDIVELYFDTENGESSLDQINIALYKYNNQDDSIFQYDWFVDNLSLSKLSKKAYEHNLNCKFEHNFQGFSLKIGDHCYALTDEVSLPSGEIMIYKIVYHQHSLQRIYGELYSVAAYLTEPQYEKLISICASNDLSVSGMINKFISKSL